MLQFRGRVWYRTLLPGVGHVQSDHHPQCCRHTGTADSLRAGHQTLTFRSLDDADDLVMRDEETGTQWHLLTGVAIDGPLAGESLCVIPTTAAFWFDWVDYYPETSVYGEE